MNQYRPLGFADSDQIKENQAAPMESPESLEEYESDLLNKLNAGEITQNQYNTLTKMNSGRYDPTKDELGFIKEPEPQEVAAEPEVPQEMTPQYHVDESY